MLPLSLFFIMETNLEEQLHTILQNRVSIFPYQYEEGVQLDDSIIERILESAIHAPNHKRTEPWRFVVFSGEGRKYLVEKQVEIYKKYSEIIGEKKLKKLQEYPLMSSHVIVIGMKRSTRVPETEEILAMGCVIENMFLTATALGVGCYLSTGGITYIEQAKELFGLSPEDKLIGFFYVGKKKEPAPEPKPRDPLKDKVKWIREQ